MPDGCKLIRQAPLIAAPVRLFMTMESSHSVLSIVRREKNMTGRMPPDEGIRWAWDHAGY